MRTGAVVRFLTASTLSLNRLLDFLLAYRLQLFVLRRRKNLLQLRRGFRVNSAELFHLLHWGKGSVFLNCFDFWSFSLEDRQKLDLLFGRKIELLR